MTSSRAEALARYVTLAAKKKKKAPVGMQSSKDEQNDIVMIAVGRMTHNKRTQRGKPKTKSPCSSPESGSVKCDEMNNIIKQSLSCPNELHVIEEIGRGGFGCVSKAVWRGTIVAAKEVPLAGNAKVLDNELAVYRTLNHPNILTLLGTQQKAHSLILIMNYVKGRTLYTVIFGDSTELTFQEKARVSQQMAQALVFMHTSSPPIVHLDVKPENILVEDKSLHVYLADFGLGRQLGESRVLGTTTKVAGTPGFQAPEKLRGEAITTAVDVYAMGGVITELFSGAPLYNKMDPHTIMFRVAVKNEYPDQFHLPLQWNPLFGSACVRWRIVCHP